MNPADALTASDRVAAGEDWHEDGALLLSELKDALSKYVILPSEDHLVAVTLWIAATHLLPAFEYAPRLVVRSPEKRSGKSRLLEIIDATCHQPLRAVNATVAAIFRSLDEGHPPTLLIDEADTLFSSRTAAEQNEDLRGLLNAGFQRGLPFLRTVGNNHEPKEFGTFAMAALAGIGRMPDTIEDRAVVVPMRRRKPTEKVEPYRIRRDQAALRELRGRLSAWALPLLKVASEEYPSMPLEDRAADTWEPLVTVADLAGGPWPSMAREAALALAEEASGSGEEVSLNLQLLRDIHHVFTSTGSAFLPSKDLIARLHEMEESPWVDWELTPSKLGHRLKDYGIRTSHNTAKTQRGYRLEDFQDTFDRYTRPKASEPVQAAESRGKVPDTFKTPDTFKASGPLKASGEDPRNHAANHLRTPSDASPATAGGTYVDAADWVDCAGGCGLPLENAHPGDYCAKCEPKK